MVEAYHWPVDMRALAVFAVLLLVAPAFAEKDPKACEGIVYRASSSRTLATS